MPQKKVIDYIDVCDVLDDIKLKQCLIESSITIIQCTNGNEDDLNKISFLLNLYREQITESMVAMEKMLGCQSD